MLGPGVDITRNPLNGRNFEYAGEDPYLAGRAAAALITGIQSQHVIAIVKHYALNDQEASRMTDSSDASERTMQEIDLPRLRRRGQGRGRLGHVLLQPHQRRVRVREPRDAARRARSPVRLHRVRHVQLGRQPFDRCVSERRHGHGDAGGHQHQPRVLRAGPAGRGPERAGLDVHAERDGLPDPLHHVPDRAVRPRPGRGRAGCGDAGDRRRQPGDGDPDRRRGDGGARERRQRPASERPGQEDRGDRPGGE